MEREDGRTKGTVDDGAQDPAAQGGPAAGEDVPVIEKRTVIADAVAAHIAEQRQGIRIACWQDQVALVRRQASLRHAECWPSRKRIALNLSGVRALEKMYQRIERSEGRNRTMRWWVRWHSFRFLSWTILTLIVGWFLPRCWCRKEDSDAG